MREFKFRVWNIEENEMFYNEDICFISPCDNLVGIENDEYNFVGSYAKYGNSLILMQYTGMRDMYKKEIYEGDILEHSDGTRKQVAQNLGTFIIKTKDSYDFIIKSATLGQGLFLLDYKIIGNVYENKDLLE